MYRKTITIQPDKPNLPPAPVFRLVYHFVDIYSRIARRNTLWFLDK